MSIFKALVLIIVFICATSKYNAVAQTPLPVIKVQPNQDWCLGCICEAISNCNRTLRCDGDVCGLFRITWAYWADAGKLTVNNEDPNSKTAYANCANDQTCAGTTVSNYLKKFAQDCNGDSVVDCKDYAAIHYNGGYGCGSRPLTGEYGNKFSTCLNQVQSLGAGTPS